MRHPNGVAHGARVGFLDYRFANTGHSFAMHVAPHVTGALQQIIEGTFIHHPTPPQRSRHWDRLDERTLAGDIAVFPWLRLARVSIGLISESKIDLLATTRVHFRVWPNDLDFNGHVNNGRYLALADIGRIHWFVRTGVLGVARRHKAFPIIGDAIAKFRQDLRLFQRFEIHTHLIGWDRKWGFLEHRFVRNDRVIGVVAIRGVFKGPSGPLDPGVLLAGVAHSAPSPELPEWANRFHQGGELLSELLREEERLQAVRGSKE